jgi:hypothetical protein
MNNKKLPIYCPSCNANLKVEGLYCDACETSVKGLYEMPLLLKLSADQQQFIFDFIKCSGSLKEMASKLGLSYPTVRNMLDAIINDIQTFEKIDKK